MATNINGLLNVMDEKFIDRSNLLVLYTFEESGSIINKAPNYSGQFSGQLFGSSDFFHAPGTGFATGHYVSIQNTGNFFSSNFSHLFFIQKSGNANDNYFSSLAAESGFINSGYLLSSNNLGNLVFSFNDCTGPQAQTSSFVLNNTTCFAAIKNEDTLSLYQYTPVSNLINGNSFQIVGSQIFTSNFADLFFANHAPAGFLKDFYSGFVFNYMYFNTPLSSNQIVDVFSGLFTTLIFNTGSGSSSFDECTGIFVPPVAASISSSGLIPSGINLTRHGIVLLRPFCSGSKVLIDYDVQSTSILWNKKAFFDSTKNNFVISGVSTVAPIVYINGQRVVSGLSQVTGQFCSTGKVWEYDYSFSGKKEIDDADSYNINDSILYDISSRHVWQQLHSGTGTSVNINTGSGIGLSFNGQRINDFSISGSVLTLDLNRASGDLICIDYYESGLSNLGELYTTGFFFTSGAFVEGTSRVFLNGQRQCLGVDYIEIISGTLLQDAPITLPQTTVVNITNFNLFNL
jgi:hypothetical protein